MQQILLVGQLVVAALLALGAVFLVLRAFRDRAALCIAGFSLAAAASLAVVRGPLGALIDPAVRLWVPLLAFGFGFSFLFAFTVLYGAPRLGAGRRALLTLAFLPAIVTIACFAIGRDTLVGPHGGFSALGFAVFYIPEALAALLPLLYFGWKWHTTRPGVLHGRYMWLVFPFAFWSIHDGLVNGILVHLAPERFPFLAGYPSYLIPLNLLRICVAAAIGIVALGRSLGGSRQDRPVVLFIASSFALSTLQYWDFAIHFFLNGVMFLLILYGFARYQVLDIDLKIKWTVHKGTLVATALGAGLLGREAATAVGLSYVALLLGVLTALFLAVVLARFHRVTERVADAVMPSIGTQEHIDRRRFEIYQVALQEALRDADHPNGHLDPDRAAHLAGLRARLGILDRDHAVLLLAIQGPESVKRPRPQVGATFGGRYEVQRNLGQGGHATAYLARDKEMERSVVLKVLHDGASGEDALREARTMAAVQHPNVATIYSAERIDGTVLLVMEYLRNGSLEGRLKSGPLDETDFRRLGDDLLRGIGAIHAAGAVHRDIKPANVLFDHEGRAKITDFGVASGLSAHTTVSLRDALGTVQYMAPEQARGHPATAQSDLYSAAATLYEAWEGSPLRRAGFGETTVELRMRIAMAETLDAPFAGPPELRAWFKRALASDPGGRFIHADAMRHALGDALGSRPVDAKPTKATPPLADDALPA